MLKKIVALILVYCLFIQCLGLDFLNLPGIKANFATMQVQAAAPTATLIPLPKLEKENETLWVDDALPAGAQTYVENDDDFNWVSASPAPYSGEKAHKSRMASGLHQHYFENATASMKVPVGSQLFCWVYIDYTSKPREIILQWNDGSWEHRAYWGENLIGWGTDGTTSRKSMGSLPKTGEWVRLSVPASAVGLEGHTVTGMAFGLYDGEAAWDAAGVYMPEGDGIGLRGEYFGNTGLTGDPTLVRSGEAVNFNWGEDSPDSSVPVDYFSARWTGQVQPRYSETYTFYTNTDDGVRLWVNGQLIIDQWVIQGPTQWDGTISLEAGKKYDIKMEYYEQGGGACATLSWASPSQVNEIIPKSCLYLPPNLNGNGTGLKGEYFSDKDLNNLILSRSDATINFDWGTGAPASSMSGDNFSVRWTGQVQPRYTGTYTFKTNTDDGVRLWVNGTALIDDWTIHAAADNTGTISLEAGEKYDIRMEYFENDGGATAKLYWSAGAQQPEEIIPESQLYLPEETTGDGTGLTGEYFNDTSLTNLATSRIDPQVNFDWGVGSPDPVVAADGFSVRWRGYVQPKYSGTYTFYTKTDDGVRLWVNNQSIVDDWNDQNPEENSGSLYLEAGVKYPITMEYYENTGGTLAQLSWKSSFQAKEIIPSTQLYPLGGLKGEYFNDTSFTALKNTRIDNQIDFDWGEGRPDSTVGTDYFTVRWSGQVQPLYTENYTFYTSTDDGARLWVDGRLLIDDWTIHGETENSANIQLEAGKKYDIVMEYYEGWGGAVARLKWSSPSQEKQVIPQSRLSPSMDFFGGNFKIESKTMPDTGLCTGQLKDYPDAATEPHCNATSGMYTLETEDSYSQEYTFLDDGNGAYFIKANNLNKYLSADGDTIYAQVFNGTDSQKWYIRHSANGYYRFISKAQPAKCLTQGGTYPDGVCLGNMNGNDNQLWNLIQSAPDGNNFSRVMTDLIVSVPVFNPPLVRKYDPSINMGSMGKGWMTGFEGRLIEYPEVTQSNTRVLKVIATLPDGSIHNYTRTSDIRVSQEGDNTSTDVIYQSADSKSFMFWHTLVSPEGYTLQNKYLITTQDKTTYDFDEEGKLFAIYDRYGNEMTITYSGTKVDEVHYTNGRYLKYCYGTTTDTGDLITEVRDYNQNVLQRSVFYEYDTKNRLLKRFINAEGKSTYYSYDNYGLLCGISDHNGNTLAAMDILKQGNSKGRVYSTTDAFGNTAMSTQFIETDGKVYWTFTKDSAGRQTVEKVDSNLQITTSYDVDGGKTVTEYYSHLEDGVSVWDGVKKVTDRYGNVTRYEIDPNNSNNVTKIINPDGSFKTMWYEWDNLIAVTDEEGYSTLYQYDAETSRELLKECRFKTKVLPGTKPDWPVDENAPEVAVTSYEYNYTTSGVAGVTSRITEPSGDYTDYIYNLDGTLNAAVSYKDGTALTTAYQYDGLGFKQSETSPEGYMTCYTYDKMGNITKVVKYDKDNVPRGITRITYDHMGRQLKVVGPGAYNASLDDIANGQYDINLQESSKYTAYTYYPNGKVQYEDDGGNRTSYTYDIYGNIRTKITSEDARYTYNYDVLNRLTDVWFTDGNGSTGVILEKYVYTSDLSHSIEVHTIYLNDYETSTSLSEFDYAGRPVRKVNPDDTFVSTEYNKNGTVYITRDENGSKTVYNYNGFCNTNGNYESKLTQLSDNSYSFVKFEFDKDGKVSEESYGGTTAPTFDTGSPLMKKTYIYYSNGLLWKMSKSASSISDMELCDEYDYDKDGNITSEKTYQSEGNFMVTSYENNYLGKPVQKTVTVNRGDIYPNNFDDSESEPLVTQYEYDPNGNIIHETTPNGITTDYYYDAQNRLIRRTRPVRDQYGQSNTSDLYNSYSSDGKLTYTNEDGILQFFNFNRRGNLVSTVTYGESGPEISSTYYDRAGRVIAEVSAANYDSSKILEAMNRTVYTYDKMGRVSTVGFKGTVSQYNPSTDQLENVTLDMIQNAYQYDAKGNVIKELDASGFLAGTGTLAKDRIRTGYGTEYTYDKGNRVVQTIDPISKDKGLAFQTKYVYDALGYVTDEIEATGNEASSCAKTSYTYDFAGNVLTTSCVKCTADGTATGTAVLLNTSTYNRAGDVLTSTDGNYNTTVYEYNQLGEIRKETLPGDDSISSAVIEYQYDEMGNLAEVVSPFSDALSKVAISSYDSFGRVISSCEETSSAEQSIATNNYYDTYGRLIREVDGNGAETEYSYDSSNRVIRVKTVLSNSNEPERSQIKSVSYDKNGNIVSEDEQIVDNYDTVHRITRYTYDALDRLVEVTDPAGNVVEHLVYDYDNRQTASYDADGHTTIFEYDKNGRNISTTDPLNHTESIQYDNSGNVFRKTDAKGHVTEYTYNIFDELTQVKAANSSDDGNTTFDETTSFEYDANGNMTKMTNADGSDTLYRYNADGKVSMKIDPEGLDIAGQPIAGKYESYSYYPDGSLKSKADRNGSTLSYTYNVHGDMISQSGPGVSITYQYDNNGNQTQMTDATGTTARTYDKLDRVLTKTVPGIGTLNISYDIISGIPEGEGLYAEQVTDPKGNITTRTYDACGRLKTVTDCTADSSLMNVALGIYPTGSVDFWSAEKATDGIIDVNNYCDSYLWGAGNGLQYIQLDLQNSFDISQINLWHYFGDARSYHDVIVQLSNTSDFSTGVTTVFNNDTDDSADKGAGTDAEYTETSSGKAIEFSPVSARYVRLWSNGSTANASNHYSEIQVLGNAAQATYKTAYEYNADGSRKSVTYPGGTKEEYTYNEDGQPITLVNKKADESVINSYTFDYDENHNITTATEQGKPTKNYSYDWLNRLLDMSSSDGKSITYTYDMLGNRTTETVASQEIQQQETTYTYDNRSRLTQSVTQYPDVVAVTTVSNTYDNNGNLTQVTEGTTVKQTNTYDCFDQLVQTVEDGHTIVNSYNGEGRRVSKSVDGIETKYLYEGNQVILETDGAGNQKARNTYGTNLVSRNVGGEILYYMYNLHGDVSALVNALGTVVDTYDYDIFGKMTPGNGNKDNPYTYGGYYYDKETGLYYLGSRMYDPMSARFLQEDTYTGDSNDPLTLNLYAYCANNPVKYIDPDGHSWFSKFVKKVTNPIASGISSVGSTIADGASSTARAVASGVTSAANTVASGVTTAANTVASGVTTAANTVASGVTTAVNATGQFIDEYGNQIGAIAANAAMVAAGAGLMVATFGGASVLAGGMIGAGISGVMYTATNFNDFSWSQWGINTGVGAATGMLTAGVGSGIGALGVQGAKAVAIDVVAGAGIGALDSYVSNGIQTGEWSGENAAMAAGLGAAAGAAGAGIGAGAGKIVQRLQGLKSCSKLAKARSVAVSIVGGAGTGAATGWVANGIMTGEWTGENAARAAYLGAASGAAGGAIGGISKSFGMCFVAGTMVATAQGLNAIENIKAGDMVYAEDTNSGEKGLKKVTEVFESETDVLVEVTAGSEKIDTTVFHPFCVEKDGTRAFVEAQYLKDGDKIITKDGKKIVVKSVCIKYLDHVVKVYNFEVEDWHDYYVGMGSLLVHNPKAGCSKKDLAAKAKEKQNLVKKTLKDVMELKNNGAGLNEIAERLGMMQGKGKGLDYSGTVGIGRRSDGRLVFSASSKGIPIAMRKIIHTVFGKNSVIISGTGHTKGTLNMINRKDYTHAEEVLRAYSHKVEELQEISASRKYCQDCFKKLKSDHYHMDKDDMSGKRDNWTSAADDKNISFELR